MRELTVEANMEHFDEVMAFVEEAFEEVGCRMKNLMQFTLAADEIFTNICSYAYKDIPESGDELFGRVRIEVSENCLTMTDAGKPYNPLEKPDPDVTLDAEKRNIGGLGIFMVKNAMDEMHYEYKDGRNVLTMIRR